MWKLSLSGSDTGGYEFHITVTSSILTLLTEGNHENKKKST